MYRRTIEQSILLCLVNVKKTLHLPCRLKTQRLLNSSWTNTQEENIMSKSKTPMTNTAAARIQGAQAKANGGQVAKGSFAARAQRAAAKNSK